MFSISHWALEEGVADKMKEQELSFEHCLFSSAFTLPQAASQCTGGEKRERGSEDVFAEWKANQRCAYMVGTVCPIKMSLAKRSFTVQSHLKTTSWWPLCLRFQTKTNWSWLMTYADPRDKKRVEQSWGSVSSSTTTVGQDKCWAMLRWCYQFCRSASAAFVYSL